MKFKTIIMISWVSLFLTACGFFSSYNNMPGGMGEIFGNWGADYKSNGEEIYFTAVNNQEERIRYSGGPSFGGMMGGRLACVSCHGEDARGGLHGMHMQQMDAPDIRYSVLAGKADEADEHGGDDHHAEEYGLESFGQAVVFGQHPDGDLFNWDMPRWEIDEDDLFDLFEYLKTLP